MIREYMRRGYRTAFAFLYARTNYKFFLKTSFAQMNLRMQQLAALTDHFSSAIRPVPISAPFGDSMLVVAPHQDDEAIGCGGALALQVRAGRRALVTVLQDGGDGHEDLGLSRPDLTARRNEESRRCAALVGVEVPLFLGYADLEASAMAASEQLGRLVRDRKVDAVFVPFILDDHPDHRTANFILANALRDIGWNVRVFGYEVWGLSMPTVIVAIDEVIDLKLEMLSCFQFANSALDYVHSTKGLNMYRTRLLGSGMSKYAECFFEVPREDYIELVDTLRAAAGQPFPSTARRTISTNLSV